MRRYINKLVSLLLSAMVFLGVVPFRANADNVSVGDVNADGRVNISDVARFYAHFQGNSLVGQDAMDRSDLDDCGWLYPSYVQRLYDRIRGLTVQNLITAVFQLPEDTLLSETVTLTGRVVAVNEAYDSHYGNITVTILVEGSEETVRCYRMTGDQIGALALSDTITVTGQLRHYKGLVEFAQGCRGTVNRQICTAEEYNELVEELTSYLPVGVLPRSLTE